MASTAKQDRVATTYTLAQSIASPALASSATVGRQSAAYDNSTDEALDAQVWGLFTTGSSPVANSTFEQWLSWSADGTDFVGGATGSGDASFTPNNKGLMVPIGSWAVTSGNNLPYYWGFNMLQLLGCMPKKFVIVTFNITNVNPNATAGNHYIKVIPIRNKSA